MRATDNPSLDPREKRGLPGFARSIDHGDGNPYHAPAMKHHCRLVELTPRAAVFEATFRYEKGWAGVKYKTHPEEGLVFASTHPDILQTISTMGRQVGDTLVVEADRKGQIQPVKAPEA